MGRPKKSASSYTFYPLMVGQGPGQLHYVDLMGLVEISTQSQKAAGIRMTHFMIVV
jgi:hypothetical protein